MLSVRGDTGVRQYLAANERYFDGRAPGRAVSMVFPFPAIAAACPVCGTACGAVYRGYYRRWGVVPEAPYVGWVAVRTAFCKRLGRRYALFPDFLIPIRTFSREAFLRLAQCWRVSAARFVEDVDRWFDTFEQEVYLSASTLYAQLRFVVRELRLGWPRFGIAPFHGRGLSELARLETSATRLAITHPAFGLGASSRIDPPP